MTAFLLDANLSPRVARYLSREFGLNILTLRGTARDLPDRDVIEMAARQQRVVITLDGDFAEHVIGASRPLVGVIHLDLPNTHRTVTAINEILGKFFLEDAPGTVLDGTLTVITDDGMRRG